MFFWFVFCFFVCFSVKKQKLSFGGIPNSSSKLFSHFFVRNLLERPKEKLRRHTPGIAPEPT